MSPQSPFLAQMLSHTTQYRHYYLCDFFHTKILLLATKNSINCLHLRGMFTNTIGIND
jgi:hypothetical protein